MMENFQIGKTSFHLKSQWKALFFSLLASVADENGKRVYLLNLHALFYTMIRNYHRNY